LQEISNSLPSEDPAIAATAEDWRAQRNRTQPHALTQVDLGAPTDPIGDAPALARMRHEIEQARAAASVRAQHDTTPMDVPLVPPVPATTRHTPAGRNGAVVAMPPPRGYASPGHEDIATRPPPARRNETQPMHAPPVPSSIQYVESRREAPSVAEVNALLDRFTAAARERFEAQQRAAASGDAESQAPASVRGGPSDLAKLTPPRASRPSRAHGMNAAGTPAPAPSIRSKAFVFGITLIAVVCAGLAAIVWADRTASLPFSPSQGASGESR
jgi:hypothetical protein